MANTSNGHLEYIGQWDYILGADGSLFRADRTNPLDIYGYRQGCRFECYSHLLDLCLELARDAYYDELRYRRLAGTKDTP